MLWSLVQGADTAAATTPAIRHGTLTKMKPQNDTEALVDLFEHAMKVSSPTSSCQMQPGLIYPDLKKGKWISCTMNRVNLNKALTFAEICKLDHLLTTM